MASQETTIIKSIWNFLFGYKYYANIVNTRGTFRTEICSYIFRTKEEAERHRRDLDSTITFQFLETVSFRSRASYYTKADSIKAE